PDSVRNPGDIPGQSRRNRIAIAGIARGCARGVAGGRVAVPGARRCMRLAENLMSHAEARRILRSLSDGIDPLTGEALGHESIFDRPDVIRALFTALEALDAR